MTEADQHVFQLNLEPVPWERFAETVGQKGEVNFQAIEQRASEEQLEDGMAPLASEPVVGN
jgi:hypothetical protein